MKHWVCFKNIFGPDDRAFDSNMTVINKFRNDAHAKKLTMEEMHGFRVCITSIENQADEFLK